MLHHEKISSLFDRIKMCLVIVSLLIGNLLFQGSVLAQTYNGYTLYSVQNSTKAYLVDMTGTTYHSWTFTKTTCYSSYLMPGGVILRSVNRNGNSFSGGPISGEVQKVDWSGNVLWDFVYSTTDYCTHHDIHPMPNGNVLLICYERKTAAQATQAGCSQSIEMWPEKIVEIQPSGTTGGTVVWEWHAWDHLSQNYNSAKSNYVTSIVQHPELLHINYLTQKDWLHANGIDYNAELDQITFSSHNMNEVYVIDHSTTTAEAASHAGGNSGKGGDILYRWGNPTAYQASGTTIFNVVHDAHWVTNDHPTYPNSLCGFNNKGGTSSKTCTDIFTPPISGYTYSITPGLAFLPSTYNWRHTYSGTATQNEGNSQQLPNGNTLMCISFSGLMYEINPAQTQVWSKSVIGTVSQAFRYPPCYISGTYTAAASATPSSVCPGNSVQLNVTATGGDVYKYTWASSPAGFNSAIQNPIVSPTVTTTYAVTIKNGPCTATNNVTVTVNPLPVANAGSNTSIVAGSSTQIGAAANAGSTYSWVSNPAGFTSTLANPTVSPAETTTYTLTETIAATGCSKSTSVEVTVTAPQVPVTLSLSNQTVSGEESSCFNAQQTITAGGAGSGFVVEAGGSATLIAGQNILLVPNAWIYQSSHFQAYITTDGTYCPSGSDAMTTAARLQLPGRFSSGRPFFTVYPNPARNYFTFELQDGLQPAMTRIQVLSIDGKELLTETLDGISKKELSLRGSFPRDLFYPGDQGRSVGMCKNNKGMTNDN